MLTTAPPKNPARWLPRGVPGELCAVLPPLPRQLQQGHQLYKAAEKGRESRRGRQAVGLSSLNHTHTHTGRGGEQKPGRRRWRGGVGGDGVETWRPRSTTLVLTSSVTRGTAGVKTDAGAEKRVQGAHGRELHANRETSNPPEKSAICLRHPRPDCNGRSRRWLRLSIGSCSSPRRLNR